MQWTHLLPPNTRAAGTVDPANDANSFTEALAAMGASLNVQNPAFAGGADPAGAADSTAAIQAALTAASAGQVVHIPAGVYAVSSTLTIPSGVVLRGSFGPNPNDAGDTGSVLKPAAAFTGASVLSLADVSSAVTYGGSVVDLAIDGISFTASALDGIRGFGPVRETALVGVSISNMSGWGVNCVIDSGVSSGPQYPFQWHVSRVMIDNCGAGGLSLTSMTDATFVDVYVLNCGKGGTAGPGWLINWAGNSHFTNCRGEWCGTNGFHLTGAWFTGAGSGGMTMTACSTDRNEKDGVLCDATGNGPLTMVNLMLRRDGRNAKTGGGNFSGLNIASATIPVIISAMSVYPGVDDDGTGTNSPQFGVSISGAPLLAIDSGYVQAATAAIHDTHSGGFMTIGAGMITSVGTPASPGSYTGQSVTGFVDFKGVIFADAGVDIDVAGQGLSVKEGSNAKQGTATLASGTVTVANTSVTANSRIFLTAQNSGTGTPGALRVSARTAGASFAVTSSSGTDNSTFAYEIVEPG